MDWLDIADADWYFLQRQEAAVTNQAMAIFLGMDPSEYQDDNADPVLEYDYSVSAGGAAVLGDG